MDGHGAAVYADVPDWSSDVAEFARPEKRTRRAYRRLLTTFAFRYFPTYTRLGDLDPVALQGSVTWLTAYRGDRGRLSDRSIAKVMMPLRLCLASKLS